MAEPRYACRTCGTWGCSVPLCGGSRASTDVRYVNYPCPLCRGREGVLIPTMHTARMWRSHNTGELPPAYPYGQRPEPGAWTEGFGPRTVPPVRYRGIPMPDEPVDTDSWRKGVDAVRDVLRQTADLLQELNELELKKIRDGNAEQPWWYIRDQFAAVLGITFADEPPEEDEGDG
jgi:hypothetical protein